jgi:hypothetical protein
MTVKLMIGVGLVALGLYSFVNSARMRKRSLRTNGRIVRYQISTSKHFDDITSSTSYIPIIAYSTPDGRSYECNGDSTPREPRIGAKVQLQYDPLHPQTAWERNSGVVFMLPFTMTIVGIVLVGLGLQDGSTP